MSVYQYVDPTAAQAEELFWSLVPVVAEQAGITEGDAFRLMQRAWSDAVKGLKPHHAVDHMGDGRSAAWRVRLTIWTGETYANQFADTDDGRPLDQDGATILMGLPAVSAWVRELCAQAHPGCTLEGLSEHALAGKLKSLRVSLSNQGGSCIWRLRYVATPPERAEPEADASAGPMRLRARPQRQLHCMAHVRVTREESPRDRK